MGEQDRIVEDPARVSEDADRVHREEEEIRGEEEEEEEQSGEGLEEWESEEVMEVHVDGGEDEIDSTQR